MRVRLRLILKENTSALFAGVAIKNVVHTHTHTHGSYFASLTLTITLNVKSNRVFAMVAMHVN